VDGETRIRCNVSSWYVEPAFRGYATMLVLRALKHKFVTYFNITPSPHTLQILEAQGYERYCDGRFVVLPSLFGHSRAFSGSLVAGGFFENGDLSRYEIELLLTHKNYGCITLACSWANRWHPFVFLPLREVGIIPFVYLVYCRCLDDFVQFVKPLGQHLA